MDPTMGTMHGLGMKGGQEARSSCREIALAPACAHKEWIAAPDAGDSLAPRKSLDLSL